MAVSPKRKAARRPAPQVIDIVLGEDFPGWEAKARIDVSARLIGDMTSGDEVRVYAALDKIVVEHNFPDNETGELAASLIDVSNKAVMQVTKAWGEAINKLPNE